MINIQFTKDHRIRSYTHGYVIEKYTGINKKTGEQVWTGIKYHSTWNAAILQLENELIKTIDASSIKELKIAVARLSHTLEKALL